MPVETGMRFPNPIILGRLSLVPTQQIFQPGAYFFSIVC
ncbi:hypothetical protein CSC17_4998 [Klebsiella oxytoca]|nr:hypothetical protein CSC17_4998 [Klebsiella oxytoca]AWF50383.1 hypothetical protein CSC12_1896 [Klebsiella michiganensis]